MKLVKTNLPGFMKDEKSGTLINTDNEQIRRAKIEREQYKKSRFIELRVEELEKRVTELEELLKHD